MMWHSFTMPPLNVAIDVGGVLIVKDGHCSIEDTTAINLSSVHWVSGAEAGVQRLASEGHTLWILSFCGRARELETRAALRSSEIISSVIPEPRWIFTRSREAKLPEMRNHALTILIDDTWPIVDGIRRAGLWAIHFGSSECPGWADVRI